MKQDNQIFLISTCCSCLGADSYERVDLDVDVNCKQLAIQLFNSKASKHFMSLLKMGVHIVLGDVQLAIIYDNVRNPSNDTWSLKKVHNEGREEVGPSLCCTYTCV
jgi:hypothetical protein